MPTKVRLVKAMVFPVVMYGCESWTVKKGEHRRIDAFELWCWRRLLRVPWTARYKVHFTKDKLAIHRKALGSVYLNLLKKTGTDVAVSYFLSTFRP